MALAKFGVALKEKFPELDPEISEFMASYMEKEQKEFQELKHDGKLTFGKFKGYSLDELANTSKGKEYLQWLMAQSFFSEDKFAAYHKQLKVLGIKKKKVVKAPLE